jgi:nucleotide-binding universal stress UspA family protein
MDQSIVVGTDGSETAARALAEAIRMSKALNASMHVVSAFEPLRAHVTGAPEGAAEVWKPLPDAEVESILSEAASAVRQAEIEVTTHAVERDPVDALLGVADEVQATMIVVGSKGMHGAKRFSLGNVPNKISHRARCNVLIVATENDA